MGTTESTKDLARLRARVAELEARNRALSTGATGAESAPPSPLPRGGRWRAVVSAVLIVVGLVLAPLAVLGPWVRAELVDTDKFVATLAPLVEHEEVQAFISDQAMTAFDDNVPVEALVGEVFDGLSSLNLPSKASAALTMLEGPAAAGIRSLVESGVGTVVASPQFAEIWERTLRQMHNRAIQVLQGQPGTLVVLSDEGVLSLDVGELTGQIKAELQSRGISIADVIPEVDRSITLVSSDSLTTVRTIYLVAVGVGLWMPVVVLGLLVAGVITARKRLRAVAWTAAGVAASLLILATGIGIGRTVFVSSLSPSVMSASAARTIYEQVVSLLGPTVAALVLTALIVMVAAWLAGDTRPAKAARGMAASASHRRALAQRDRHARLRGGRRHRAICAPTQCRSRFVDRRWHVSAPDAGRVDSHTAHVRDVPAPQAHHRLTSTTQKGRPKLSLRAPLRAPPPQCETAKTTT